MRHINVLLLLCLVILSACNGDPATRQETETVAKYEPTDSSLATHPLPDWYQDGKLGIFVCWGLYSVPGWADATDLTFEETIAKDGGVTWFANNPYAEWYLNSLKIEGSSTQDYHTENYGEDFSYYDFVPIFNEEAKKWDPAEMADLFAEAGAAYVVLVTKFHDGFILWPTETPNPKRADYVAERDIVGELTREVRENDMKMGFYYSSGLDWTFNDQTITDINTLFTAIPQDTAYAKYIDQHWRELMAKYDPSILWADIGSPEAFDPRPLIADFYNQNEEGVVNNRHKMQMAQDGFGSPVHHDFTTPEYQVLDTISDKKWETVRGIGLSFGYNRTEDVAGYASVNELVDMFVDIVSKNGNLLLNVGPRADGSIPGPQAERLRGLGEWYQKNREAIYGTRAWKTPQAAGTGGERFRFTSKGDSVYLIALDPPVSGDGWTIPDFPMDTISSLEVVGAETEIAFSLENGTLELSKPRGNSEAYAFSIK